MGAASKPTRYNSLSRSSAFAVDPVTNVTALPLTFRVKSASDADAASTASFNVAVAVRIY